MVEQGRFSPTEEGSPQGGVISPLLMNVALHGLDEAAGVRYRATGTHAGLAVAGTPILVRYADDLAVCCCSRQQAEQVKARLAVWLAPRGLVFNEDKTRIVHLEEGFDFLGFNLRRYRRGRSPGKLLIKPSQDAVKRVRSRLADEVRRMRGSNAMALIARLNPIIRGWAAYYRGVVSSKVFHALDDYVWRLTFRWACHTHPKKPKMWIVRRYFGRFNRFRNNRWVFGARDHVLNERGDIAHLTKFSWTNIVRHQLVAGGASPDDPDLTAYWAARRRRCCPRWTATTCACSLSRTGAARCAGTTSSPPISHRNPHRSGSADGWASSNGPSPPTTSPITGEAARRTETEHAWYTPPVTAACRLADAGDRNPRRPRGLLEPSAGQLARSVLRGPRRSNAPGLPDCSPERRTSTATKAPVLLQSIF